MTEPVWTIEDLEDDVLERMAVLSVLRTVFGNTVLPEDFILMADYVVNGTSPYEADEVDDLLSSQEAEIIDLLEQVAHLEGKVDVLEKGSVSPVQVFNDIPAPTSLQHADQDGDRLDATIVTAGEDPAPEILLVITPHSGREPNEVLIPLATVQRWVGAF